MPKSRNTKTRAQLTLEENARKKEDERSKRATHDFFAFWTICREKPCHRARGCVGELYPCFARHWPHVPEEKKNWFRAFIKAWAGGVSKQEAARIADAEAERIAALLASLEMRGGATRAEAPVALEKTEKFPDNG